MTDVRAVEKRVAELQAVIECDGMRGGAMPPLVVIAELLGLLVVEIAKLRHDLGEELPTAGRGL